MIDIQPFIGVLIHPRDTFQKLLPKADLKGSVLRLIVSLMVVYTVVMIIGVLMSAAAGTPLAGVNGMVLGVGAIIGLVFIFFQSILYTLFIGFSVAILRFLASLMGGKGTYAENMQLFSYLNPSVVLVSSILFLIPEVGIYFGLAWWGYSVYLAIHASSVANRLTFGKAAIPIVVPILIIVILLIVLFGGLLLVALAMKNTGALGVGNTIQ